MRVIQWLFRCLYSSGFKPEETTSVKNRITHKWYKSWDIAQQVVQYAYEYTSGDMDFIYMLECESANNPLAKWDSGKAYWICQMHSKYHDIPQQYYDDWKYQVEYCYDKYKWGTKFYWPSRMIKWQRCSDYVKSRFLIE